MTPWALAAHVILLALLAAAAVIDARERRLPNPLAAAIALAAAACSLASGGPARLAGNALFALAVLAALAGFELAWRRARGSAGQGMGDVKAVSALALASPLGALAAYALALAALAATCAVRRERALPLMPFLAAAFAIAVACGI